ncbi:MAG: capsular polysaccharide biosynthesis protein [Verrucomicrobiales bacterium]|nr:capsular polysaccharide biosynthesis protein [Verrucomicrobiales bacterium]
MGAKSKIKSIIVSILSKSPISSKYAGPPKKCMSALEWFNMQGKVLGASLQAIYPSESRAEPPPITLETDHLKVHRDLFQRETWPAFVCTIPKGRVWGKNGAVITSDDVLLEDVSREFGCYGGVTGLRHSIFKQIRLGTCMKVGGCVAVVASAGAYNYYHWLFDILPRIQLLKDADLFKRVDYFLVDYHGLKFQDESLLALGVPLNKIIVPKADRKFQLLASSLVVPSLPGRLGAINPWPISSIRKQFLKDSHPKQTLKLYISRRRAPTRKITNEAQLMLKLKSMGFEEFFPEDYSITCTASLFSRASFIIGAHGAGLANLVFCSTGACAIDIVAPRHVDGLFWILCNLVGVRYAYLFGEGPRPLEGEDLVLSKKDEDITVDLDKLCKLYERLVGVIGQS